jgi:putative transposase
VHDSKLLEQTLKSIVCPRPKPRQKPTETLCVDAGYVGYPVLVTSRKQNYQLNLKTRSQERQEKLSDPEHQARRWVVERTHSWINRFRTAGQLREDRGQLFGTSAIGRRAYLLETDNLYLRINSKLFG